jgi:hypothetical protein
VKMNRLSAVSLPAGCCRTSPRSLQLPNFAGLELSPATALIYIMACQWRGDRHHDNTKDWITRGMTVFSTMALERRPSLPLHSSGACRCGS